VEIPNLARELEARIATAVADENVPELLKLIDNKGLLAYAASCLKNTRRETFESWLVRSLLNDKEPRLRAALKRILPTVENA
jgi:hypothetical protein